MKYLLISLLCGVTLLAFTQTLDKSTEFNFPKGKNYVLQLKNGNTFMLEITNKKGINIWLFDPQRDKKLETKLNLKLVDDKASAYFLRAFLDIGGNPTFFLSVDIERTPTLLRVVLDGKTGEVKSEANVAQLETVTTGGYYGAAYGGDYNGFTVVKDNYSDFYAVIRYNSLAAETKDRIEALHFDPTHKLINSAKFSPTKDFKFTKYLNVFVNQDKYLVLASYAYNTDRSGGDDGRMYVSQLLKGKTDFNHIELGQKVFYKKMECMFEFNKLNEALHMIFTIGAKYDAGTIMNDYVFININPRTMKVNKPILPDFSIVSEYYKNEMNRKDPFRPTLIQTGTDKEGNLILYFSEKSYFEGKDYYDDVARLVISVDGKTINSSIFPITLVYFGVGAYKLQIVTGDLNGYVLFNNSPEEFSKADSKKFSHYRELDVLIPVKYTFTNKSVWKEHLLNPPQNKKDNPYCDFNIFQYDPITKTYVTLFIDPAKPKTRSLVWGKLE